MSEVEKKILDLLKQIKAQRNALFKGHISKALKKLEDYIFLQKPKLDEDLVRIVLLGDELKIEGNIKCLYK